MTILPSDICLSRHNKLLLLNRNVFHKTVVAAWADLDIADAFVRYHDISRVPKRQQRQVIAYDLPGLCVELLGLIAVSAVDGILDGLVDERIAIATAVTASRSGN